tara:strand:+ start:271 stop:534 length:264 start_codon:yes stop_codon:yes gene_type:complete
MKANYTDFSKGKDLKDCFFMLMKSTKGNYILDTVYASLSKDVKDSRSCFYSYEEALNLNNLAIKNKNTTTKSYYKTGKTFFNRLSKI